MPKKASNNIQHPFLVKQDWLAISLTWKNVHASFLNPIYCLKGKAKKKKKRKNYKYCYQGEEKGKGTHYFYTI